MKIRLKELLLLTPDKRKCAQWRVLNNCPAIVLPNYEGYTGAKYYRFPTRLNERGYYPDITEDFDRFKHHTLFEIKNLRKKSFGYFRVLKRFLDNFGTGELWDMKFQPNFPGRNIKGENQYAKYKGEIVVGNYVSNNLYGYLCAAIGLPEWLTKFIGRIYTRGLLEPFISGKIPNTKLLRFKDPASDQIAISRGYKEFQQMNKKLNS